MIELRDYQRDAIDKGIYEYFRETSGNPLIVVPTAGGKSLIIAQFLREIYEQWPDQRVLILTHVKELIRQNHAELVSLWPEAPAGINSAGLNSRDFSNSIIFAGIQSVHKHAYRLQRIDLVLVDEAHLIPRTANTMYRRFLSQLLQINPYMKIIGLTATPFRLDSGMLHEGDDALFTDISYEINVVDLIERGFLARPTTASGLAQINTVGVGTRGGEFIANQLEAEAIHPETVARICDEIVSNGEGRHGWLVFGCGVKHATMMRGALVERGISCENIFGDTPAAARDEIVAAFKAQEIRALAAMNVLTTGFNARHVDLIALARPTKSTGLYIQIVGRGLRTFSGKDDCLILDFGGNIRRHGPIDSPRVKDPFVGEGAAPSKTCPECGARCNIAATECPECGFEFDPPVRFLDTKAAQDKILQDLRPEWLDVTQVHYARHNKPGKPPSLRVDYHCGLSVHREWICLEHDGYARAKAMSWWMRRAPEIPVPDTIDEALTNTIRLKRPTQICVRPNGRFTDIVGTRLP
jgi:DNA repair protein RadD